MELTEEHIIRSTSPDDLTMEQRYSQSLKLADLVAWAMGYERNIDSDDSIGVKGEKKHDNGRRVSGECG